MRTRTQRRIKRRALKRILRTIYGFDDLEGYQMKWYDTHCGKGLHERRAYRGPTRQELISEICLREQLEPMQPLPPSIIFGDVDPDFGKYDEYERRYWEDAAEWDMLWEDLDLEPDPHDEPYGPEHPLWMYDYDDFDPYPFPDDDFD